MENCWQIEIPEMYEESAQLSTVIYNLNCVLDEVGRAAGILKSLSQILSFGALNTLLMW